MNTEEHDELWRLLGKASDPTISPYFSRNILRTIRETAHGKQQKRGIFTWVRSHWAIAAVAACVVLVSGVALIPRPAPKSEQMILLAQQFSTSPDYQVVNHLDELMDSEKNSVWLEN